MKNLRPPKRLSLITLGDSSHPLASFRLEGSIEAAIDAFYTSSDAFVREIINTSHASIHACLPYKGPHWLGKVRVNFDSPSNGRTSGVLAVEDDGLGFNFLEMLKLIVNIERLLASDYSERERWSENERGDKRIRLHCIGMMSLFMVADSFSFITCRAGLGDRGTAVGEPAYKLEGDRHGNYRLSEMDDHYHHGSVLCFEIKGLMSERYTREKLQELLSHFFEHSAIAVGFKAPGMERICLSERPFPEEAISIDVRFPRHWGDITDKWRDFAESKFKEAFTICFPVHCEEWHVHGIACILHHKLHPLNLEQHMAYSRGRYVSREIKGLAPDFVRCLLEIGGLELNACQEDFLDKEECWAAVSLAVFAGLKTTLEDIEGRKQHLFRLIGNTHRSSFAEIARRHPDSVFSRILETPSEKVVSSDIAFAGKDSHQRVERCDELEDDPLDPDFSKEMFEDDLSFAKGIDADAYIAEINRTLDLVSWRRSLSEIDPQLRVTPTAESYLEKTFSELGIWPDDDSQTEKALLNFLYAQDADGVPDFLKTLEKEDSAEMEAVGTTAARTDLPNFKDPVGSAPVLLALAREERDPHKRWLLFLRAQYAAIQDGERQQRDAILALTVIHHIAGGYARPLIRLFWPIFYENFGSRLAHRTHGKENHYLPWAAEKVLYVAPEFHQIPLQEIDRASRMWRLTVSSHGSYNKQAQVRMELHHALRLERALQARERMHALQELEKEHHLRPRLGPGPGTNLAEPTLGGAQDFGCDAYARQIRILYHCSVGDAAAAWCAARHDMEGRGACVLAFCSLAPREAISALLGVLHKAGMHTEAQRAHQLGLAALIVLPQAIGWLGDHLRYMVRTGAVAAACSLLDETLLRLRETRQQAEDGTLLRTSAATPFHRLNFLRGAIAVMRARRDPREKIAPFRSEAKELKLKFRLRNRG